MPNSGLAVAIDVGESNDIHPKNKQEVGRRLALVALAGTYGKNLESFGPAFRSAEFKDRLVRLSFDYTVGGLMSKGALKGFAIAGPDRKFVWANATIEGSEVLLSSPAVDRPVAARYAWANNPEVTLYNKTGLPAAPFRTNE